MGRVHISTGKHHTFFSFNDWQKRQYGENTILFKPLPRWHDIQCKSRHSASQSAGTKTPQNP